MRGEIPGVYFVLALEGENKPVAVGVNLILGRSGGPGLSRLDLRCLLCVSLVGFEFGLGTCRSVLIIWKVTALKKVRLL